jgi:TetR/AcrR family transcriptional repressor of nem operon
VILRIIPPVIDEKISPREQSKQATREALLKAGMDIFSEEGVDLPSLDAICAHAGFTRGAFYVHFKDRDDFLAAVVKKTLHDFVNSIISQTDLDADLSSTVARFMEAVAQPQVPLLASNRLFLHLLARGSQRSVDIAKSYHVLLKGALEQLTKSAQAGQEDGTASDVLEPDLVAVWLLASALGFTTLLNFGIGADFDRIQESTKKLFLKAQE